MNIYPVFVRYTAAEDDLIKLKSYFSTQLLVINTGKRFYKTFPNCVKVIDCDNSYREVGAYLLAADSVRVENNCAYLFMNDTIFTNMSLWKIKVFIKLLSSKRFSSPTLYGFQDKSFDFHTGKWFGIPGWHIRTDIFGFNSLGIQLFKKEINITSLVNIYNSETFLNSLLHDFVSQYHPRKVNQMKEFATFFEIYLSQKFRDHGLIYCALNGRKSIYLRSLLSFYSFLQKKLNL